MRLILRFALLAVGAGLLLGVLLRAWLGRGRFVVVAPLALLPLAVHGSYLTWLAWRAALPAATLLPFVGVVAVLLVVALLLSVRWARGYSSWAALLPALAALVYALPASLLSVALSRVGVQPNAVWAAVYGLITILLVTLLLVFVPGADRPGGKLRSPWRGP